MEVAYESESKGYLPALLAVSKDSKNNIRAVQIIYLDKEIGNKADIKVKKRSYGTLKGSLVEISKSNNESNTYIVAEGIETALSIKEAGINANIYMLHLV
ncbi:hypothetical protein NOVO_02015 [Rickettsiales bacterium Ac37b]|nr:hypothetical protein NOVO_02015 [Rickettsiales bacterium Ac37b]